MSAVYSVVFPSGFCLCGSRLTVQAKKTISAREKLLLPPKGTRVVSAAPTEETVEEPVTVKEAAIPRLDLEFLRVVLGELVTLTVEERDALRADYIAQVTEAQTHLESLLRVVSLIDSFGDTQSAHTVPTP